MKEEIAKLLAKEIKEAKLNPEEIESMLEIPPSIDMGDFSLPCFRLAGKLRKNPVQIADELAGKIKKDKTIEKIEAKNGYLNFFVKKSNFADEILGKINKDYGKGKEKGKKELVMVEFSQANTHKAFHVGHIRGTSIGESISRILEFENAKVIRANYQGDTGMHVAKWLWCYLKYHKKEGLKEDEKWVAGIYVDAVKRLGENEKLQQEVEEINRKLEEGKDKALVELWKKTRKLCLEALEKVYKELNTHFDKYYFESEVEKRGKEIAQELVKKGIAKISEEAAIMDLEKYGLSVWVLLRKDGTVLYSAKDIALAYKKFEDFKLDRSLYMVADEQNLHMRQLLKTLELMKFPQAKKCRHISYALVRLPTGKMSSRTGDNILYSEFKEEMLDYAKKEIKKRWPKLKEKEIAERALKISIAAIKYAMLRQDSNKVLVFSKESAMSFEGDTGPYLQYSYARASSILKKSEKKPMSKIEAPEKLEEKEIELIKKIGDFPKIVEDASRNLNPSIIAHYSFELAQVFNEFYHNCPVIDSKQEEFRLKLVDSFRATLKNALYLLGIEVMEEM